ncbi:unnamed protein product [Rotaria socialis]|uniref:Uncharacterized protein n=1 Tax=Rotaria socialis TaxID=392032 RepID=A0A817Q9T7_9BILA|nr:unnamed protein product [Rotaria socialis]CAF3329329.1 unnamed protein product [Rotaria socialis]CAF3539932.1 unnamed protein product [Rotaria socialis]CAF4302281.1 unnamed protein product [Rotaria socialis]CAF4396559.1 unnamed protein product [Rotaria socialis]
MSSSNNQEIITKETIKVFQNVCSNDKPFSQSIIPAKDQSILNQTPLKQQVHVPTIEHLKDSSAQIHGHQEVDNKKIEEKKQIINTNTNEYCDVCFSTRFCHILKQYGMHPQSDEYMPSDGINDYPLNCAHLKSVSSIAGFELDNNRWWE